MAKSSGAAQAIGAITLGGIVVAGVVSLTAVFGSWYSIDEGERGVVLRNGAYMSEVGPGLHFKFPFIDSVAEISLRDNYASYPMQAYSRDQQVADLTLTVTYRIDPSRVREVYTQYGSVQGVLDRLITRKINDSAKNVFGSFNAQTSIQERGRLGDEIYSKLSNELGEGSPVLITGLQVEDISFSDAYETAIEARMQAEVEVQRHLQTLEKQKVQAAIEVTNAQGIADSAVVAATADAEAIRLRGQAEADAINARGKALRDNPALVDLVTAERWDGKLPISMPPNGTVPFLSLDNPKPSL